MAVFSSLTGDDRTLSCAHFSTSSGGNRLSCSELVSSLVTSSCSELMKRLKSKHTKFRLSLGPAFLVIQEPIFTFGLRTYSNSSFFFSILAPIVRSSCAFSSLKQTECIKCRRDYTGYFRFRMLANTHFAANVFIPIKRTSFMCLHGHKAFEYVRPC